jgi:exodeoxyribonuclease V alpha subunit
LIEEKRGTITGIVFRNEQNGYTVAELETDSEWITIVGKLPRCVQGMRLKVTGEFKVHPRFGEQFNFTAAEEVMPEGKEAIYDFLCSDLIKGTGPATARLIVTKFGDDTLRVIEEHPERLKEIRGIGPKTAEKIASSYAENRMFARVSIEFQEFGLTPEQAYKLYKTYGVGAVEAVKENPYRLADEVRGFGFRKADAIAAKLGSAQDSPERVKAGIVYTLRFYADDGSTYVPADVLTDKAIELLDVSSELIQECLTDLAVSGTIKLDDIDGTEVVYLYPFYAAEQQICANFIRIQAAPLKPLVTVTENLIDQAEEEGGIRLSEQQRSAVKNSVSNGICVITGGPGTGKTTIIRALLAIFERSGFTTLIAAPTGRAAKRITETSGHEASTIHRLLEYYYDEDADIMRFGKNADEQLECDVLVVDEASMIDLMLMNALTEAIKTGTRLILIGDSDQLPPVGPGNVLRDVIDSGYAKVTKLTEIFRQAEESLIVVNAHRINSGEYPEYNRSDNDFFFMERRTEAEISSLIRDLIQTMLPSYYKDLDPLRDIQVLTPVRKGMLGTASLNVMLQGSLNPPAPNKAEKNHAGRIFREGDKVMQIRNNYEIVWKSKQEPYEGQGIFNGDVGFVASIDKDDETMTVIFDGERYVTYDFSQLDELEHAYAVTVHKSQGSEFPAVVMPISWFPPMLSTRNLLYTAVTRGKKLVVLCGSKQRMNAMIDNNRVALRYSGLGKRLEAIAIVQESAYD